MAEVAVKADRRASDRELESARNFILSPRGPGVEEAAKRLGMSSGYVSQALRGMTKRVLTLSDLRKMKGEA